MNGDDFGGDLGEFARRTLERADLLIRAVGIKTFSAVIKDTPVGNPDLWQSSWTDTDGRALNAPEGYVGGRLRANWNCSLGAADVSTSFITYHQGAIPKVVSTCTVADRNSELWLSNSLPYASRIEYDGHSRQAPQGMVRRNVTRIKQNISNELRRLRS